MGLDPGARGGDPQEREFGHVRTLETLIKVFWKPLYFFVRQKGFDSEGFLTTCLEKGIFTKANPARGRFRTFLLASFTNYVKDALKAETVQKRGGSQQILSLDFTEGEREYTLEVPKGEAPEIALHRAWAKNLWKHALSELEGDSAHLEAFRLYLADVEYDEIVLPQSELDNARRG